MNTDYFRYCPKCGARALELCLPGMIKFGRVGSAYHRRDSVQSTPYGSASDRSLGRAFQSNAGGTPRHGRTLRLA
jgi:hypothetical protein